MIVKNKCARLIVINDGKTSFNIIPGVEDAVELSSAAAKLPFTQASLKKGDLVEVAPKPVARSKKSEE